MNLPEKIQELRKQKGFTQEALAEALEVSRQAVSKWESDQSVPEIDKIIAMSDLFNVPTDYLLKQGAQREKNSTFHDDNLAEKKKVRLIYMQKFGLVLAMVAVSGLIGQYLLKLLSIVSTENQGFIFGFIMCLEFSIIGFVVFVASKVRLANLKEPIYFSIYKTMSGKIAMASMFSSIILLMLVHYIPNGIIAFFCYLLWLSGVILCIFNVLTNKKSN